MQKYVKVYFDFFKLGIDDYILCQGCNRNKANDIHHLAFRSQGGKDEINNLIALCRECHNKAHSNKEFNELLRKQHVNRIKRITENKS